VAEVLPSSPDRSSVTAETFVIETGPGRTEICKSKISYGSAKISDLRIPVPPEIGKRPIRLRDLPSPTVVGMAVLANVFAELARTKICTSPISYRDSLDPILC